MGGLRLTLALLVTASTVSYASPQIRLQVPFFPDKSDQCGPATLAGVLSYWGKSADPKQLKNEMYVAKLHGTLPMDLVSAAEAYGLNVKMVAGNIDQIRNELKDGRPVLAMINTGFSFAPVGHYVVITGFEDKREGFYMHSGGKANQFISYRTFQRRWKTTDYWAMLASASLR